MTNASYAGEDPVFGNISDTACWVAALRGMETERKDACFQDPFAKKLAGSRGQEMVRIMPGGKRVAWAITLRTCAIDDLLLKTLAAHPVDTVLNLAAGLDCRPYRLPLSPTLKWIEVDLPEIMAYKSHQLKNERPRCHLERISLDLTDLEKRRELFKRIKRESKSVFVITEGLLVYLKEDHVIDLSKDLISADFDWWLQDFYSDKGVAFMKVRFNKELNKLEAPLNYGTQGGPEYFEKQGWKVAEFRSTLDEIEILGRARFVSFVWRWLGKVLPPKFQNYVGQISGYLLLGRSRG